MLIPLKNYNHFQKLIASQIDFLVYKYNPNQCRLSDKTKPKIESFLSQNTQIDGYLIDVIEQIDLKLQVAEYSGIPHESPQVLCFRSGIYHTYTSHMKIREEWLKKAFENSII